MAAFAAFGSSLAPLRARADGRFSYVFAWDLQPPVPVTDVAGIMPLALKAAPEIVFTLPPAAVARLQMWFSDTDRGLASARKSGNLTVTNEFGAAVAHFHFERLFPVGFSEGDRKAAGPVRVRFRYGAVTATK